MITVFDNTPENDPSFMEQRIEAQKRTIRKLEQKIHELKSYVFWHKTQQDKWKTKHDVLKIQAKELETKIKLLTGNDN